jgi:hypothetical protein
MRNDRRFTLISAAVITFAVFLSIAMQDRVRASANEDISGRILTLDGRGVTNAGIFMLLPGGEQRYARTNPFGYFHFKAVPTGQALNFTVVHKRLSFQPQNITISGRRISFSPRYRPKRISRWTRALAMEARWSPIWAPTTAR